MNLQYLRIEALCQQFKLDTFTTDWPALAQQATEKATATQTFWSGFCIALAMSDGGMHCCESDDIRQACKQHKDETPQRSQWLHQEKTPDVSIAAACDSLPRRTKCRGCRQ